MEAFSVAMTNRSLRAVKMELEFLAENGTITHAQLSTMLSQLPESATSGPQHNAVPTPAIALPAMNNLSMNPAPQTNGYGSNNEKNGFYNTASTPTPAQHQAPPPAYPATPQPPIPAAAPLTHAVALYAYNGGDAGDLALQINDRVAVTEYMNADWWKGRNERTGQEGIFPRNYVRVEENKGAAAGYGNMPVEVAQGGGGAAAGGGKGAEMGKKFGKKLGNAAVFGAGATIGSNIVNSIF